MEYPKEVVSKQAKSTEEVVAELAKEGITAKVSKPRKAPKTDKAKVAKVAKEVAAKEAKKATTSAKAPAKAPAKANTSGLVTIKDLEAEFGLKGKIIRRHLRKMEESTKVRGPQRYEWEPKSTELKAIKAKLTIIATKKTA